MWDNAKKINFGGTKSSGTDEVPSEFAREMTGNLSRNKQVWSKGKSLQRGTAIGSWEGK